MADAAFDRPVVVLVDPRRPELGVRHVACVSEGLTALFRHGLGEVRDGPRCDLWRDAAEALALAAGTASPEDALAAREALCRLAKAVAPISRARRRAMLPDGLALWHLSPDGGQVRPQAGGRADPEHCEVAQAPKLALPLTLRSGLPA